VEEGGIRSGRKGGKRTRSGRRVRRRGTGEEEEEGGGEEEYEVEEEEERRNAVLDTYIDFETLKYILRQLRPVSDTEEVGHLCVV
jgi:hypothetical protein